MKLRYLFPFAILFAPALSHAQAYGFNCDTLQAPSSGCKSYNEMIANRDKELMEFIDNESDVYVCFRPMQDTFLFLGFKTPDEAKLKAKPSGSPGISGQAIYFRYTDGVLDDSKVINGLWKRFSPNDEPVFFTNEFSQTHASISDSEFWVSYSFPNLSHKTTDYSVTMRRSTLRFSEQYTFPDVPMASKKGVKQEPTSETDNRLSYTGYCAQIKSSAPIDLRTPQQ